MTNESHSSDEIENQIERDRAELTDTLDELQDRFSVEKFARQFTDQFREHGGDIGRSVSDAVKRNPVGLALTGIGLAWLMMGDRSNDRDHHSGQTGTAGSHKNDYASQAGMSDGVTHQSGDRAGKKLGPQPGNSSNSYYSGRSTIHEGSSAWAKSEDDNHKRGSSFVEKAKDAGEGLAQGTAEFSHEARERVMAARQRAIEARDGAVSYVRGGRERALDIFEQQPLIAGALAVAMGAALGAAIPRSKTEDAYMGEQSDAMMAEAERIFEEEKAKAGKVFKATTDEAKDIMHEAKDWAEDAAPSGAAAQSAVDATKSSAKRLIDAAKSEADEQNLGNMKT